MDSVVNNSWAFTGFPFNGNYYEFWIVLFASKWQVSRNMNDVHLNHFKLQWFTRNTIQSQIGHNAGLKIGFKELVLKIIPLLLILSLVSDLKSR